jgi:hypothetical protein
VFCPAFFRGCCSGGGGDLLRLFRRGGLFRGHRLAVRQVEGHREAAAQGGGNGGQIGHAPIIAAYFLADVLRRGIRPPCKFACVSVALQKNAAHKFRNLHFITPLSGRPAYSLPAKPLFVHRLNYFIDFVNMHISGLNYLLNLTIEKCNYIV